MNNKFSFLVKNCFFLFPVTFCCLNKYVYYKDAVYVCLFPPCLENDYLQKKHGNAKIAIF